MKHLKLIFACLLMAVLSIGQMWGAEELKATLDFTSQANWNIPTSGTNTASASFTDGVYTIQLAAATNYKLNSGYLILGKSGSSLTLPAFEWTTTKILVTGTSGASPSVKQNIFVGSDAVSTETTGAQNVTNTYEIASASQAAGTIYILKITSAHNTQIAKIEIYGEKAATTTPTVEADLASVAFGTKNIYDVANRTGSIDVAVSGSNLTGNITAALSGDDASKFSISGAPFAPEAGAASGTLTVSYEVTEAGVYEASLTLSSEGAENVVLPITLTATNVAPTLYDRVESDAALSAGAKIIIVNEEYKKAAGAISGTLLSIVDITDALDVTNGKLSITEEAVQVFTLGGEAGAWTLTSDAGQLSSVEAKKMLADGETTWAITIADGNAAPVSSTAAAGTLQYNDNSGSGRFTTYTSTQKPVQFYAKSDGKSSAGLAYAEADQKKLAKLGEAFTAPTLDNPNQLTGITYASSDEAVAEVNENTGAVTIKAVGVAEITASFGGNDDYKAGDASYTIAVTNHAGTAADPFVAADAKIVIDAFETFENVHVSGIVSQVLTSTLPAEGYISFNISDDGALAGQQTQAYKCKSFNGEAFTAITDVETGATVIVAGNLKKYQSTYEFDQNCYLVSYTAPAAQKQSIANTKETAYSVAQALVYAANGVTYDLDDYVYIQGVVFKVESFNSTNGTLNIFIKDANAENQFEFFKCAGINDGESTTPFEALTDVQEGDEVIGYGQMMYYQQSSIYEFKQGNYLVELTRPDVPVTGIDLTESTAEVEVGSTVTLHASVVPGNATDQGIVWSVTSGSDKASVDENGVVTGVAEGTAVIRAASHEDATINAECTVTITAVDPTKHTVTFDATVDISEEEASITKGGITITASKFNNDEEGKYYYQCYANTAMTVSSTVGNITNIELTCTASGTAKYGPGNWDFTGYSYSGANGSWTGSAETVEFGNASQQVRMTLITVTYKEDNRAAAGLAWSTDAVELTVGDEFTAPTLSNPNNISASAITIESSNTDLAVVNDGVVSLVSEATGEATITATFAGNDDYKPATVSYNITVNAAAPTPLTDYYEKVTSGAVAEGTYLIVYEAGNVAFNGGLETLDASSNTIAVNITNENKIGVTETTAAATFYIDPTAGTIQAANGKYIGQGSDANGLAASDNALVNTLSIDESGDAVIVSAGGAYLRYNATSGQERFRYFKSSSYTGQKAIQLYKLHGEVIKPASGLAWDPAGDIELTVGEALSAPALLNPNSIDAAEITIESSNTDLATVSEGVVSLVADATGSTTITATYTGETYKPITVSYKIKVNPASSIYVSPSLNVNFGSVAKDAALPADKTITVTLNNVALATAVLGGTNPEAFSIDPATLTESGDITISVVSTATVANYSATLTISDEAGNAESKVVNLSFSVTESAGEETPVSTTSKWVPATEIVDGMQVLIVGVNNTDYYAMGAQSGTGGTGNNRVAVAASVDGEGVLTPGENTMAFTLVAQGDGTYAIRTSNGKYLYAAASGNNYLKTQDEVDVNAKWTMTVASASAEGSSNRHVMQFNSGSTLFSCYNTASQKAIALYVPKPVVTYVAKIGETMYESLPAAVAAAQDGDVVELLMDVAAGPGVMITTAEHKQIIIDFGNHTYCATSPVGSAGTENQAFHFEKGCNITLQNGTITSSGNEIIMLIQNYGDLTLLNITLIGTNLPGEHRYVLSNNCGNVVIGAGTTITAKEGDVAFNVCVTNDYPEGTQVTVKDGATITGIVEYGVGGTIPADNKATLTIEGGNFNITWNVVPALEEDAKDNINVKGGIFNAEVPADYCALGYVPVDNGSGQYGVYYAGYYERGSLTPGNYATICLPYAGKISGASLFDIEYHENSTLYLLEVEGNAMVAGRPYIFLPSVEKIEVTYTDNAAATAGSFNGLVGSLSLEKEEITANAGNYILYNNAYYLVNSLAYVGANRAYIHMADVPTAPTGNAPGRRRVAMTVHGEQVATGIDALNASDKPVKMIIDGQLFIIRGEKMFNANGQLVK